MADSANLFPEEISATGEAFTQTLAMENAVFQGQLDGAIEMTVTAFRELILLCKEAIAVGNPDTDKGQQKLEDTAQKAVAAVQNATSKAANSPTPASPDATDPGKNSPDPAEVALEAAVLSALGRSYENAVTAQQQTYITQQAAATQIITTILSVATATLGVAVKEAESV
ncbi:RebB family R body protein [Mucilaginibacter sp. AW1-3]